MRLCWSRSLHFFRYPVDSPLFLSVVPSLQFADAEEEKVYPLSWDSGVVVLGNVSPLQQASDVFGVEVSFPSPPTFFFGVCTLGSWLV